MPTFVMPPRPTRPPLTPEPPPPGEMWKVGSAGLVGRQPILEVQDWLPHDAGDNAVDAAVAVATPETPVLGLSLQQVSDVKALCSIEMHKVGLKWVWQDCEVNCLLNKMYDFRATVLMPPMIQFASPAPTEAFQFLTEVSQDQWTQWSPLWMLSNFREDDRALVVKGPQLLQDNRVVSI